MREVVINKGLGSTSTVIKIEDFKVTHHTATGGINSEEKKPEKPGKIIQSSRIEAAVIRMQNSFE